MQRAVCSLNCVWEDPGEKPSGEKPSNLSGGENPSAGFATCGEKPSPFLGHVEKGLQKGPQFLQVLNSYNSIYFKII